MQYIPLRFQNLQRPNNIEARPVSASKTQETWSLKIKTMLNL